METHSNTSIEHLSIILEDLTTSEKIKLFNFLSEELFEAKNVSLSKLQKEALNEAIEKELKGNSVFHSWQETKNFVRNQSEEKI